jgi:hypothetical protein
MTWGNWLFWGIMAFIAINLLWIGLLELFIPLWVGLFIGMLAFVLLLKYGPRLEEEEEE